MEDAALLRPETGSPLVFTVDFITPVVDDPESYGAIAAANSLSDVYAMGGRPQAALAICGFPEGEVGPEVLKAIFRGGRDKAAEAGCPIVGGHTVIDPEMKYGLCVIGTVDSDNVLTQSRAQVGDRLLLTKPIGTGIAAQGIKNEELSAAQLDHVISVMRGLNDVACEVALAGGANAATDVTGFGLLGHLHHVVSASGVSARISRSAVPEFDCVADLLARDLVPGGTRRNLEYVAGVVDFDPSLAETDHLLLADAQTSGGLLLSVPAARAEALRLELERRGTAAAADIGEVTAGEAGRIEVTR